MTEPSRLKIVAAWFQVRSTRALRGAFFPRGNAVYQVEYDMHEVPTNLEFILEQVIYGAEVVIRRYGVEVARITAIEGLERPPFVKLGTPFEH